MTDNEKADLKRGCLDPAPGLSSSSSGTRPERRMRFAGYGLVQSPESNRLKIGAFSAMGIELASRTIHSMRVENLQTRLGLRKFVCATLELEFELAQSVAARKTLAFALAEAMKGCRVLQLALDILEREEESGQ